MKKVNVTFEECNAEDLIKIASILGGASVQIEKPTEEKPTESEPKETAAQKKKRLAAEKKAKEDAQKAAEELAEDDDEMTFGADTEEEEEEEEEEEDEEKFPPVDSKVLNKLMSDKMSENPDFKIQIVSRVTKTYKVKKVSELTTAQNIDFYKFLKGLK